MNGQQHIVAARVQMAQLQPDKLTDVERDVGIVALEMAEAILDNDVPGFLDHAEELRDRLNGYDFAQLRQFGFDT